MHKFSSTITLNSLLPYSFCSVCSILAFEDYIFTQLLAFKLFCIHFLFSISNHMLTQVSRFHFLLLFPGWLLLLLLFNSSALWAYMHSLRQFQFSHILTILRFLLLESRRKLKIIHALCVRVFGLLVLLRTRVNPCQLLST